MMEGSKMQFKIFLVFISLLIFTSCDNIMNKSDEKSDDQLMQEIIDSDKININLDDLPTNAQDIINTEHNDYIGLVVQMAPSLCYQVSIYGKGYAPGEHKELYFNKEGILLRPRHVQLANNALKCFELIFPVTFIMADGSLITVEERQEYSKLRMWHANNLDIKVKPTLQYPVSIIYRDGNIKTIYIYIS